MVYYRFIESGQDDISSFSVSFYLRWVIYMVVRRSRSVFIYYISEFIFFKDILQFYFSDIVIWFWEAIFVSKFNFYIVSNWGDYWDWRRRRILFFFIIIRILYVWWWFFCLLQRFWRKIIYKVLWFLMMRIGFIGIQFEGVNFFGISLL